MSTYVFRAIDLAGVKAKGEVDADSKQAVSDQLKARGLIIIDIADKHRSKEIELEFLKKVKVEDLAVFSRQLATMITSGMSILRALYVLEEQSESKFLCETLVQVRKDVEAGLSLSDAFGRHPKVFSPLFVSMARAGEIGGVLEGSLLRVADQLEHDAAMRKQVRSAMVYPTFVVTFAVLVLLALVAFLIPVFEKVFKQFGGKLPTITQFSVGLSHLVTGDWWALIVGVGVLVFGFVKWKSSSWGRPQWHRLTLRIPLKIGQIVQEVSIARWSRTLASLTSAGVPLLQALEIVGQTSGNVVIEDAMLDVIASVKRGGTLAAPLGKVSIFPPMVTHMVSIGEETGALDTMLDKIAEFYEERVAASVKALTSLLEPVMIIVIGAIVGFIVISMYMPLFTIYNNIE
ncbi:MAG: type II secretion system F family protein [Solirubrobacteraceae bacterium]